MNETQLLTLMLVIKKIKKEVKKQGNSFLLIADDIKELDKRIKQIPLEETRKELENKLNILEDSLKVILNNHNKDLDIKLIEYTKDKENALNEFKIGLKGIEEKLSSYVTKEEFKQFNKQIDDKLKTIPKNVEVSIGKVETLDPGEEAKVEVEKADNTYVLNFYIPRGVSGRGIPGKGVPSGGTTNQVLAKNSNDDYDTKWVSGGSGGTSDHSELTNLDYASAGHTGFQPAGDYALSSDIPTKTSELTNDSGFITTPYTLPVATTTVLGGVKPDGSTITADANGVISATTGGGGDVTGPNGATADDIVLFDGSTGKIIKDSGKKLSEYEPVLPATPTSPETKYLNGNRQWTEVVAGSGGYAANVYLTNQTSTTDTDYKQLSYTNDAATTTNTIVTNNNEVLGQVYLFDLPLETTTIDAGNWNFTTYNKVSSTAGSLQIKYEVFKYATDTTETTLFSVYSPEIENTDYVSQTTQTTQPVITLLATDKLGLRVYAKNTVAATVTLSYTIGDGNTSWVNTPLALRHSQLRDKNDEDAYQHIDISDKNVLVVNNNYIQSSGRLTGGVITAHSPANGTVDISEMYGLIRTTDAVNSDLIPFTMTAKTGITLTDNALNYIYYDYTTATCVSTTDRTTIHNYDQFTVGRAYRTGNVVDIVNSGTNIYNEYRRIHNRMVKKYGFDWCSGATLSESDTRKLAITDGVWYIGNTEIDTDGFDTNVSGTVSTYYLTGSTWTKTTGVTQLGNTQYNNTASGLVSLGIAKYANYWVYICPQGDLYIVYGQAQYNSLAEAQVTLAPATVPDYINAYCRMVARISFKQAGTNFASVSNTLVRPVMMTSVSNHNNLGGLQGGTTDEYYHLTNAQHTIATQSATALRDGYLTSTDWSTFNGKQPAGSYEVTTNKENTTIDTSTTKYPTVNLLKTGLDGKVDKSAYDANSILYATTDNTPTALTVGEQTFVGRKTGGNISALSATEARTILNVADGATANVGDMVLATAQSVTGAKTFDKDKLAMKGTSTGINTISVANTSADSYINTLPAKDGTIAMTSDIVSQVEDSIVDGHTTIAPSGNAVYDALALKAPLTAPTFATSITGSYLTASEMLITDANKNIVSAPVATYPSLTQLSYVKGVTSSIQTQLDGKVFRDGWVLDTNTWTYASASTISINADMTGILQKGDKIKIFNSTAKYFSIIGVGPYSGGNTIITVTGGSDYTVANVEISASYYSHSINPFGFPLYFNFTPTVSADSGSITTSSASMRFNVNNGRVYISGTTTITNKGTATGVLKNTLPVTAAAVSAGSGRENSTTGNMIQAYIDSGYVKFWKYDNTDALNNGWSIIYSAHYTY